MKPKKRDRPGKGEVVHCINVELTTNDYEKVLVYCFEEISKLKV